MTAIFAWFFWMIGTSSVAWAMWVFDLIVRWQYEHLREQWELDGKPNGIFWCAKESNGRSSEIAKERLFFTLNFKTPRWIAQSPECRRLLSHFRIAGMTGIIGGFGALYIVTR
jgi:hypothetical protein